MMLLTFHGVGPVMRKIDQGEYDCWLESDHFEAILDLVQGNDDALITFDDGNLSDYEIVLPALLKRGMSAVFFICSGRLGKQDFLTAGQVRDLCSMGMKIGSHGVNHKPWRSLGLLELQQEVAGSRKALEDICGVPIDMAACPFGSYDRRVLAALKSAGYRTVFTSDGGGSEEHQWLQARTTVTRTSSVEKIDLLIRHRLSPAQRFVHGARVCLKRLRSRPFNIPD